MKQGPMRRIPHEIRATEPQGGHGGDPAGLRCPRIRRAAAGPGA
jgi:hypothetical protein